MLVVQNKDVALCTESFGDPANPAVLLMAGATVSMLYWDSEFCQQLADQSLFVIRYDNRDVGQSTYYEPATTPYTIVDLADDAMAILDAYQRSDAHLAGISLGGLIAQIAALRFPERVASLTLISTGPWGNSDPDIPEMDKRILDFQAKADQVDWTNEDAVVTYLLEGLLLMSGRKKSDKQRIENYLHAEFRRANNYISMFNHAGIQGGEDYYDRLNEISQPILIIHGTDDLIWPYKHATFLKSNFPAAKLITLEGTGHELHPDDWATISKGISRHVSGT